jgi:hypothetical protein
MKREKKFSIKNSPLPPRVKQQVASPSGVTWGLFPYRPPLNQDTVSITDSFTNKRYEYLMKME